MTPFGSPEVFFSCCTVFPFTLRSSEFVLIRDKVFLFPSDVEHLLEKQPLEE